MLKRIGALAALLCSAALPAFAQATPTVTVSDAPSLLKALAQATAAPSTLLVKPGEYVGKLYGAPNKAVTVKLPDEVELTLLAAHGGGTPGSAPCLPASVSGLCAVANLNNTAGVNAALTNSPGATPGNLPAGCSISGSGTTSAVKCSEASGTTTLANWDFTGYGVFLDCPTTDTCAYTLTNDKFKPPSGGLTVLAIGLISGASGAPSVTATNITDDATGAGNSQTVFNIQFSGSGRSISANFTMTQSAVMNASCYLMYAEPNTGSTVDLEHDYFGAVAQGAVSAAHCGSIYATGTGGSYILANDLFDLTPTATTTGGLTGSIWLNDFAGSESMSISNSIWRGVRALGLLYPLRAASTSPNTAAYTSIGGTVVEKGTGSCIVYQGSSVGTDSGGNLDYAADTPITLTSGAVSC